MNYTLRITQDVTGEPQYQVWQSSPYSLVARGDYEAEYLISIVAEMRDEGHPITLISVDSLGYKLLRARDALGYTLQAGAEGNAYELTKQLAADMGIEFVCTAG